jgi:protein required for attachment to host cells/Trp operon repressor
VERRKLEEHIRALATIEENDSPLISCYLTANQGGIVCREQLDARFRVLRKCLPARSVAEFEEAQRSIETFLKAGLSQRTRGVALFARAGERPLWRVLEFEAPLPTWIAVGSSPNIYHLMALKDNYDRYAILLMTETSARIIGVNLGSVTAQLWRSRPELRQRVGREWSKDHYQDHRRERTRQFVNDQVRSLERLLLETGYEHLILAGNPRVTATVRKALPKNIAEKVIDCVPASRMDDVSDIVASTLETFLAHEEMESQAVADRLITQLQTHGLAVAGAAASIEAVKSGQADILVIVQGYDPGRAWECQGCGRFSLALPRPGACPNCRSRRVREFDLRGEMARIAELRRVAIEVVEHSDALMSLGGVGCLLRYSGPANYVYTAA